MIKQKFVYEAEVISVHDGDTITVEIDLGFEMKFTEKIRFYGLNAPELKVRDENKKLQINSEGMKTLGIVNEFIKAGDIIVIETIKDKKEKYGRYLANIYVTKKNVQVFLNKFLLDNGLATEMKY